MLLDDFMLAFITEPKFQKVTTSEATKQQSIEFGIFCAFSQNLTPLAWRGSHGKSVGLSLSEEGGSMVNIRFCDFGNFLRRCFENGCCFGAPIWKDLNSKSNTYG